MLQADYQECLGSGRSQQAGADPAMRQQLQHPSSHHGFATDLQQDPIQVTSLPRLSFPYHLLSCPNRLNSSGQGLSQSWWLNTMLSLLYKQKTPVVSQAQEGWSVDETLVSYCSIKRDWIWGIVTHYCWFTSTLMYWIHKKEHSMWKSI